MQTLSVLWVYVNRLDILDSENVWHVLMNL